jgi:hypothetical protein
MTSCVNAHPPLIPNTVAESEPQARYSNWKRYDDIIKKYATSRSDPTRPDTDTLTNNEAYDEKYFRRILNNKNLLSSQSLHGHGCFPSNSKQPTRQILVQLNMNSQRPSVRNTFHSLFAKERGHLWT